MFDYRDLIMPVRRAVSDLSQNHIDVKEATDKDSYYLMLSEGSYAAPHSNGVFVNGIPISPEGYTVHGNIIKFNQVIPTGSEIMVQYDSTSFSDEMILGYIDDTIHNLVEPIFNTTFNFNAVSEDQEASKYITYDTMDNDLRALFVQGAAMQLISAQSVESGMDSIYIKDGETVIDTAKSNSSASKSYEPLSKRWDDLLARVQSNRFSGVVMY